MAVAVEKAIEAFSIVLPRDSYFQGEEIAGSVVAKIRDPTRVRCIRVTAECSTRVKVFNRANRGDPADSDGKNYRRRSVVLWKSKATLWGSYACTDCLQQAGRNAEFSEVNGQMRLPIDTSHYGGEMPKVMLRALDQVPLKRDEVLGEVLIDDINATVAQSQGGAVPVQLPLSRNGRPEKSHISLTCKVRSWLTRRERGAGEGKHPPTSWTCISSRSVEAHLLRDSGQVKPTSEEPKHTS